MGDEDRPAPGHRFDERDTMFARMARRTGTPAYEDYYSGRPELRKADDRLRSMPALGRAPWAHRMAVWFDDLVYGRRWNPGAAPGVKEV